MAKRFGRNQKRKLLGRIAELEEQALGPAGRAGPEHLDIEKEALVVAALDVREESLFCFSRNLELKCYSVTDRAMNEFYDQRPVNFSGGLFIVKEVSRPSILSDDPELITIRLEAVAQ